MNKRQTSIDCYNQIKNDGSLSKMRFEVYSALRNYECAETRSNKIY
jgi:hypothetical protein